MGNCMLEASGNNERSLSKIEKGKDPSYKSEINRIRIN